MSRSRISRTCCKAAVIYDMAGLEGLDHVAERRAEVAILRRARRAGPTPAHARFAREVAQDARVVDEVVEDPDLDRLLAHVLASVGLAVC